APPQCPALHRSPHASWQGCGRVEFAETRTAGALLQANPAERRSAHRRTRSSPPRPCFRIEAAKPLRVAARCALRPDAVGNPATMGATSAGEETQGQDRILTPPLQAGARSSDSDYERPASRLGGDNLQNPAARRSGD